MNTQKEKDFWSLMQACKKCAMEMKQTHNNLHELWVNNYGYNERTIYLVNE